VEHLSLTDIQVKIEDFKPTTKQLNFLESYLKQEVRKPIETLAAESGIDESTYYLWIRRPEFNKWFYDQIQVNKHRFAPRIIDNLFSQARETTDKGMIELALRVLDLYTPTTKNINENYDINYAEMMKVIKEKAIQLTTIEVDQTGVMEEPLQLVEYSEVKEG
jgi:hypothetical protein